MRKHSLEQLPENYQRIAQGNRLSTAKGKCPVSRFLSQRGRPEHCYDVMGNAQSNGLNTADLEKDIGDVAMQYNGIDRLVIDNETCRGAIYQE